MLTPLCASVSPVAQKSERLYFNFQVAAIKPSNRGLGGCIPGLPQVKAAGRALLPSTHLSCAIWDTCDLPQPKMFEQVHPVGDVLQNQGTG